MVECRELNSLCIMIHSLWPPEGSIIPVYVYTAHEGASYKISVSCCNIPYFSQRIKDICLWVLSFMGWGDKSANRWSTNWRGPLNKAVYSIVMVVTWNCFSHWTNNLHCSPFHLRKTWKMNISDDAFASVRLLLQLGSICNLCVWMLSIVVSCHKHPPSSSINRPHGGSWGSPSLLWNITSTLEQHHFSTLFSTLHKNCDMFFFFNDVSPPITCI